MANRLPFSILDADGNRETGAASGCTVSAWNARTLASRTAAPVLEVTGGYVLAPTDDDELVGTVFLIDTGAGRRQRYVVCSSYTASSQFFGLLFTDDAGALWSGAAPTITAWSGATTPDVTTPGAGVYVVVPSVADMVAEASGTLTAPAGARPDWYFLKCDAAGVTPTPFVSSGIGPEAVAAQALADWLRLKLPAKCAALNSNRAAQLKTATAGPWTFASDFDLPLSAVGTEDATPSTVTVAAGVYTAAQLAVTINDATPLHVAAAADYAGRLVLTSTVTPTEDLPSVVAVLAAADAAGEAGYALLGWQAGGERVDCAAVVAPGWRNVVDGDWLLAPDVGSGFVVRLLDRTATTAGSVRRGEFFVDIATEVWRPFGSNATPHRDRDAIETCLRAVREVVTDDSTGRQLGRAAAGDIMYADVTSSAVSGETFTANGVSFEAAAINFRIRVFQPPSGP